MTNFPPSDFPAAPPPSPGAGGSPASFGQRLVAYLIDALVALALFIPGYILFFIGAAMDSGLGAIFAILGGLLYLAAFVASIFIFYVVPGRTGQSPGKRTQGIQLLGSNTGQPIGGLMVFVRGLVAGITSIFCYIGHLWMLWDGEKKTLYDKLLGYEVVDGPKGGVLPLFPDGKPF